MNELVFAVTLLHLREGVWWELFNFDSLMLGRIALTLWHNMNILPLFIIATTCLSLRFIKHY